MKFNGVCFYFIHFLFIFFINMDVFVAKYSKKLHEKSYLAANLQCRLWHNGQRSKSYGQIKVKLPNLEWHSYSPAKLSLIIELGFIPPPSLDCSHLCHNRLCINPDHLSLEPHGINMQRVNCMSEGVCRQHVNYPPCLINFHLNE